MAKLTAPLFSFGARGKLADALVFFPWKGVNAVRSYVIPANPQTAAQVTQRGHMTAGVLEWHGADYTALDVTAFNRWASTLAKIMSGFNAMVKEFIEEKILGNTWERLTDVTTGGVGAAGFDVMVDKAAGGNAPTVHYGTRRTHFPDSAVLADQGGDVWAVTLAALTGDTVYYFYIDVGTSAADYGRTGIYQQRTS